MHTHQKDNLKNSLIEYSENSPMREVCGFICEENDSFYLKEVVNHSNTDDAFLIHPMDYLGQKLEGGLVAIFHSHLEGTSELSDRDLKTSENLLIPFLVYSLETESFSLFSLEDFKVGEKCVKKLKEELKIND